MSDVFEKSPRNRVVRRPHRGKYDKATVYDILDSALVCHIAYAIDGQPYCTPTSFWREGDHLYWHGSSASRMIRAQGKGVPVCLTVTHVDAIMLARCGFNHSVNYRSVMAYGTAYLIDDPERKLQLMDNFLDRYFPGRAATMRPATTQEIKATSFIGMEIETASGKIRDEVLHDEDGDYETPAWVAKLPVRTTFGAPEECDRLLPGVEKPEGMAGYVDGARVDAVMLDAFRKWSGEAG